MKKKLTFKQEQKRAKALNIIKWVCAGLGWSALLTCLILLLSLGVKGCNKKELSQISAITEVAIQEKAPQRLQSDHYDYIYSNQFTIEDNTESVYTDYLVNIAKLLGYTQTYSDAQPQVELWQNNINGAYITRTGFNDLFSCKIILDCSQVGEGGLRYAYWLKQVVIYSDGDSQACFQRLGFVQDSAELETYVIFYYGGSQILLNDNSEVEDYIHIGLLNPFYSISAYNPNSFTFNDQINYNNSLLTSITTPYVMAVFDDLQTLSKTYDYDYGDFISGGEAFNKIRVYFGNGSAVHFQMSDGSFKKGTQNCGYYEFMYYINTYTGRQVQVNYRDRTPIDNNGGITMGVLNSSTWSSQQYKQLTFINNLTNAQLTQLNGWNNTSSNINVGVNGSGNIGGAFDLLGNAFGALASIFSIQLLPGLTLGLFIFLPVIVTIIVLVFKAVKK